MSQSIQTKKKIIIALPGGGIKSSFQVGFLKVLLSSKRFNQLFEIIEINGVSGGAIVGAYACNGQLDDLEKIYLSIQNKDEILQQWYETPYVGYYMSLCYALVKKRGFYNKEKLLSTFLDPLKLDKKNKDIIGMEKYHCVAVSIEGRCHKYINGSNKDIKKYIAGSASLPFAFEPEEINGEHFCDGGIFELYPLGNDKTNIDVIDYDGVDNDKYYLIVDLQKYVMGEMGNQLNIVMMMIKLVPI